MGSGISQLGAARRQSGAIAADRLATAAAIGTEGLIGRLEAQGGVGQLQGAQAVGQHAFTARSAEHADGAASEVVQITDAGSHGHQQAATIEEHHRSEAEAIAAGGIAAQGDGGVAGKQIHLAAGQGGEAIGGGEGAQLKLAGIAEHGGGHGPADVHIKAAITAIGADHTEAGQLAVAATDQIVAAADRRHVNAGDTRAALAGATREHQRQQSRQQRTGRQPQTHAASSHKVESCHACGAQPAQGRATSTAPTPIKPTPHHCKGPSCSPSQNTPSSATSTTLSLSIGATPDTGPSCRARK